jgi:hypothetical protein
VSALLILTAGHTDVQLLQSGQRQELHKETCRALHEELRARRASWTFADRGVPKDRKASATALPAGAFELCTPKLDAILDYLRREGASLSGALILHTDRTSERREPSQAGPILGERLHAQLGIEPTLVSYLTDRERLELTGDPEQAVMRREIVRRLEHSITSALERPGLSQVVLAATGGITAVSALVPELVRLHSDLPILELEVADAAMGAEPGLDQAVRRAPPTDPAAVAAAQRHALELARAGNFIAALGAVEHLRKENVLPPRLRCIEWIYQWASSLPIDDECDLSLLHARPRAAHAAVRVELALRCGDLPRALQGTVAFFEAAVWDHLERYITKERPPAPSDGHRSFELSVAPPANLKEMKPLKNDPSAYAIQNFGKKSLKIVEQYLHLNDQSEHKRVTAALLAFGRVLPGALELRNQVAHGEPTREKLRGASAEMCLLGLWLPQDEAQGKPLRFLSHPMVQQILQVLGIDHPDQLCETLLRQVSARVRATPPLP